MSVSPDIRAAALGFASLREFYACYGARRGSRRSRRLRVAGAALALLTAVAAFLTRQWRALSAARLLGYLPAWAGHLIFEHAAPATFRHPVYGPGADFRLPAEVLTGRVRW
jgi:hypothetical protein